MDTTHTDSPDNFPCQCHLSQYAYEDALCPECEERERQLEAQVETDALRAEAQAEMNNQHFCDACDSMTQEDWDADNDWLASAGWGEM
jgi:hypothetical protein